MQQDGTELIKEAVKEKQRHRPAENLLTDTDKKKKKKNRDSWRFKIDVTLLCSTDSEADRPNK